MVSSGPSDVERRFERGRLAKRTLPLSPQSAGEHFDAPAVQALAVRAVPQPGAGK